MIAFLLACTSSSKDPAPPPTLSLVIPEPDFNHEVTRLGDVGDPYEDTVSAASVFAERVFDAHQRLADRW